MVEAPAALKSAGLALPYHLVPSFTRLLTEILIRCIFYYENRVAAKFLFCSSPFDFHGGGNLVKSEYVYFICGMLALLLNFESKI